jgi:type I restriction enzyme S subunit
LKLITPPITLQNKFATLIENIEQQKDVARRELKKSEELFQSLLQEAFR